MAAEFSDDSALGGKLVLRQPRRGHRFGHDAILLAAATAARAGEHAVDLGSGIGAAGLALARRVEGLVVTLVEIHPALSALGRHNAERNKLSSRVHAVCLDVAATSADFAAAGLPASSVDHVLMNPPFNVAHNPSPDPARRLAHTASRDTLAQWLGAAARLLRASGTVTLIWRADGLDEVLRALAADFGLAVVLPILPKPDAPAIRVIVRATKGANRQLARLPGFVLASADGKPSEQAEAVLRKGATLDWSGT
ncbi:MAG: methyltransferase [Xanthobacteraceae bacterium]|jgi:tRNA1(Val) A37 N6-methylase TrmN6